jgi:hypothetical protein
MTEGEKQSIGDEGEKAQEGRQDKDVENGNRWFARLHRQGLIRSSTVHWMARVIWRTGRGVFMVKSCNVRR